MHRFLFNAPDLRRGLLNREAADVPQQADVAVLLPPLAAAEVEDAEAAEGEGGAGGGGSGEAGQGGSQGARGFPVGALAAVQAEERSDAVDVRVDRHDELGGVDEGPEAEVGRGAADHPAEEEVHALAGGAVARGGEGGLERGAVGG